MGRQLPKRLLIYAFGARLGGAGVLVDARALAAQSGIPSKNLLLIDRATTYAHNDPAGAYPHNAFFSGLVRLPATRSVSPEPSHRPPHLDHGRLPPEAWPDFARYWGFFAAPQHRPHGLQIRTTRW